MGKDKGNRLSIQNSRKVVFTKLNDNFILAKCYVLALGKNYNMSYFSRENVDRAYDSLSFVPVVGHVMADDEGHFHLGGHDYKFNVSGDSIEMQNLCVPYGVAIPDEKPVYEEVTEDDGTVATYLVTNTILWAGRYPEIMDAFYSDEVLCNQSMEILYSKSEPLEEDSRYENIIDFTFDALCMLNRSDDENMNVEPCFPNSKFVPVSFSLDENFYKMFDEFKKDLAEELGSLKELSFYKEGDCKVDGLEELLKKYGRTKDSLDFSVEGLSLEEIENKLKEYADNSDNRRRTDPNVDDGDDDSEEENEEPNPDDEDPNPDDENPSPDDDPDGDGNDGDGNDGDSDGDPDDDEDDEDDDFSRKALGYVKAKYATYSDKYTALRNAIDSMDSVEGNIETVYYMHDFDDEYVYYEVETYDREAHITTFDHFRCGYTFSEETLTATLSDDPERVYKIWVTAEEKSLIEQRESDFEAYKASHTHTDDEYRELMDYKAKKDSEEFESKINEIVSGCKDISDKPEFKELMEKKSEYTLEEFRKETIYIRGLYSVVESDSSAGNRKGDFVKLPTVDTTSRNENKYEYLFDEYFGK